MFLNDLPPAAKEVADQMLPVSENAKTVLEKRYLDRDSRGPFDSEGRGPLVEDVDGAYWRVGNRLALEGAQYGQTPEQITATTVRYYRSMRGGFFLPNSPTIANAGTRTGQLSACFVLPISDCLSNGKDGIYDTLRKAQLIFQTGGGCGYYFGDLRGPIEMVNTTRGLSSGPLSFMDVYDAACQSIAQGGIRRGAQMGILRCDSPQIMEFIRYKDDRTKLTNFNVSVAATDEFLAKLAPDVPDAYEIVDPKAGKKGIFLHAKAVFKEIIHHAWSSGEPGLVFIDRMERYNPTPRLGGYKATNPCWTGDTQVWTVDGPKTFFELAEAGCDVQVLSQDPDGRFVVKTMRAPRLTRKAVEIVELVLDDGTILKATCDHNVYLRDGRKVQVQSLQAGDSLASVYCYKANSKGYLRITNGVEDPLYHHVVVSAVAGRRPNWPEEHCHHINENKADNRPENLEIKLGSDHNSEHMLGEENPMFGIWDERNPLYLIPTDGENNGRYRPDLSDAEIQALRDGGMSFKAIAEKLGCSKYTVMKRLGWTRPEKEAAVVNHKVVAVLRTGEIADVYNGTVDDTHRYFVMCGEHDAILSANCGEQPLNPWESCNLGSMTLCAFAVRVKHLGYSPVEYKFDWTSYEEEIVTAVELMDDVVDANEYVPARGENPGVPEIREVTLQTRKLGLGVMGLARILFKLGLAYNSPEGRAFAERAYATLDVVAKETSNRRAKERGAYPYMIQWWDESVAFHVAVLRERAARARAAGMEDIAVRYENLIPKVEQYGYRNSTHTTNAPTGTLSILHDTSGGCEPQFALVLKRQQADTVMYETDKVFLQELRDRSFSEDVIERIVQVVADHRGSLNEALNKGGFTNEDINTVRVLHEMSEVFVVAGDIAPRNHILMQAALQKYCCSAISKTINFPEEATEEQVAEAYTLAIETGCKGITVYRNNCRSHQPLTAGLDKKVDKAPEPEPPVTEVDDTPVYTGTAPRHRPKRLYGLTDEIETGDGRLYANVGYDPEGPREVFVELGRAGGVLNGMTEAMGRLISLSLKYRVPVEEIAKTLIGIRSTNVWGFGPNQVLSIPDAIGQLLCSIPRSLFATVVDDGKEAPEKDIQPATAAVAETERPRRQRMQNELYGESPECRECGSPMKFDSGCRGGTCTNPSCGFAKC